MPPHDGGGNRPSDEVSYDYNDDSSIFAFNMLSKD